MSRIVKIPQQYQAPKSQEGQGAQGENLGQVRGSGEHVALQTFHRKEEAGQQGQGSFGGGQSDIPTDNFVQLVMGGYDKGGPSTFNPGTIRRNKWQQGYVNLKKNLAVPNEDMATETVTLPSGKEVSERQWIASRQKEAFVQHRPIDLNHQLGNPFKLSQIAQPIRV